jgi:prepilin-type N-terminal cleavage/methylation domain-containing protein
MNADTKIQKPANRRAGSSSFISRSTGFTMVEVVIVLIIMAVGAALAGIAITSSSGLTIRTFTRELSATLRYARNHAVSEKHAFCFVINKDEGLYRLYGEKVDEEGELLPVIEKPIPEDIEVVINNDDEDFFEVEFFPHGNTSGGVIEVQNKRGKVLYIAVNRLSGKIEVNEGE